MEWFARYNCWSLLTKIMIPSLPVSLILVGFGCQTLNPAEDTSQESADDTTLAIAATYIDQGRPELAQVEMKNFLEKHPEDPMGLNMMGITQLALRNPGKAASYLARAYKHRPIFAIGLNLGAAYVQTNRAKEAKVLLLKLTTDKAYKTYRFKERILHNLGNTFEKLGDMKQAENYYNQAIEENPVFYLSNLRLSQIYRSQKKTDKFLKNTENARMSCPRCFDPIKLLVMHYVEAGNYAVAIGLIKDYRKTEGILASDLKQIRALEQAVDRKRIANSGPAHAVR
jgi:Tfp pilus assembly protein PilF